MTIQAQILALLDALQAEMGMALLFITHDLNLVRRFTHRVGVMERGRLVESGPTEQVFAAPQHPYTQRLLASRPRRLVQPVAADAPRLIEARGLRVSYHVPGRLVPPAAASTRCATRRSGLRRGETLGIVGESGSGKTTLGMALLALQPIAEGSVAARRRAARRRRRIARRMLRRRMQVVFQDPVRLAQPAHDGRPDRRRRPRAASARAVARRARGAGRCRCSTRSASAPAPACDDVLGRYPHEFSGGQRQRIAIARVA